MAQALKQQMFKKYSKSQKAAAKEIIFRPHNEFSDKVLKIYDINSKLIPFKKNRAQIEFGKVWDKCIEKFGYVRIVAVKARKRGISTEVAARFVQGLAQAETKGEKCDSLVLAHDDPSSTALFGITKKMITSMGNFAPRLISQSMHRLDTNLSSYLCMTAGKQKEDGSGKGRGMTPRQIHISEAAHISNCQTLASSVITATPCVAGTAIVLESTANGEGDYFHKQYLAAKKGETDFLPFFAPWFWDDDNQCNVPEELKLTEEDVRYQRKHDLTMRQMAWRRKMEMIQGRTAKEGRMIFKQENPADDDEAFAFSSTESHIPPEAVVAAMKRTPYNSRGLIFAGFDPATKSGNPKLGGDRMAFIYRQRANAWGLEYPILEGFRSKLGYLKDKLDDKTVYISILFIDAGGGGYDLYDELCEAGYEERVRVVESGSGAENEIKYKNRRAEMTDRIKLALIDESMPMSIDIDEDLKPAFKLDLTAEGSHEDDYSRLVIESKDDVKKRLGISPEGKDAFGLTFAERIVKKDLDDEVDEEEEQSKCWFEEE